LAGFARLATESDKNHPPIRWVLPAGMSARSLSGVFTVDWINRCACMSSLLHPWERLPSTVMSTSVCCVSVCLSVCEDISKNTSTIFTNFFAHVSYVCGPVLLWQGDKIPKEAAVFLGFLPH